MYTEFKSSTSWLLFLDTPVTTTVEIRASDDSLLTIPVATQLSQTSTHTPVAPPTSMTLLRKCGVSPNPESVCHYQGYTYVGCDRCVDRISEDGRVHKAFLTIYGYASGLTVHKHILYVLVGKPGIHFWVQKHELSGKLISSWGTSISYVYYNKLNIVSDKVIIPDPSKNQLVVFSLTGDLLKQIRCDLCTGNSVALSAAGDNSVVMAVEKNDIVFRINIDNENVLWTSNYVVEPATVTWFKNRYTLVMKSKNNKDKRICILDIDTGLQHVCVS